MSVIPFKFTPESGLLDTTAYPTDPGDETNARGQVQSIGDQLRDYINLYLYPLIAPITWEFPDVSANGWTCDPNSLRYCKDGFGFIHIEGYAYRKSGDTEGNSTILFTLPTGFRPAFNVYAPQYGYNCNSQIIFINTSGEVRLTFSSPQPGFGCTVNAVFHAEQ